MKIQQIIKALNELKPVIREKYNVKELGIFGSYTRGQEKNDSDLDILVSFEVPIGFFKFLELEEYLSDKLDIKVDLVSKKALKPRIGKGILEQVIMV
jgi:predicted nucleotidyltransferase